MANPFGGLVDDYKLKQMAKYGKGKAITQADRAREAKRLINEYDKDSAAEKYVSAIDNALDPSVSTLCLIYNATGDTLTYKSHKDWFGFIGRTPYPLEIGNGQWAAFDHVHSTTVPHSDTGAVVYSGKNRDGNDRDFLIAWCTPYYWWKSNEVYCAIRYPDGFYHSNWDDIYDNKLSRNSSSCKDHEAAIEAAIGSGGRHPVMRAIIKDY